MIVPVDRVVLRSVAPPTAFRATPFRAVPLPRAAPSGPAPVSAMKSIMLATVLAGACAQIPITKSPLQRCEADRDPATGRFPRARCRFCAQDSDAVMFDLSSIVTKVQPLVYTYDGGLPSVLEFDPCGQFEQWNPVPYDDLVRISGPAPGYNTSKCLTVRVDPLVSAPGPSTSCVCNSEAAQCGSVGNVGFDNYEIVSLPAEFANGGPLVAMRVSSFSAPQMCFSGCGECSLTVLTMCDMSVPVNQAILEGTSNTIQEYCVTDPGMRCNRCVLLRSRATCVYNPCPNNCSGHGACSAVSGECDCEEGWSGSDCNQDPACVLAGGCSVHATCAYSPANQPVCTCMTGWSGDGVTCEPSANSVGRNSVTLEPAAFFSIIGAVTLAITGILVGTAVYMSRSGRCARCCGRPNRSPSLQPGSISDEVLDHGLEMQPTRVPVQVARDARHELPHPREEVRAGLVAGGKRD